MKKLSYLLMLTAMWALMWACGGSESADTEEETTETEETTEIEENTEADEPEETAETAPDSETAKMLAKKWEMTSYTHTDGRSEENLEGDFLILNADGTFSETFKGKEIASGKWSVSEDEKQLTLKHETGEFLGTEKMFDIKEVSAEKLVMMDDEGKMTETFTATAE